MVSRVEIALSFLISSWVLVGPGLEFPHLEKTGRGPVSTRLVFLVQKKLIVALSGSSEEFLVSLKYGKSICIWRESLFVIFVVKVRSIRYNITFILYSH